MVLVYYQDNHFAISEENEKSCHKLSVKESLVQRLGASGLFIFLGKWILSFIAHGQVKFPGIASDKSTVRGGIFKHLGCSITPGFQGGQIGYDVVFPRYDMFLALHKNQAFTINNTVRSIDLICGRKGSDPNN